METVTLLPWFHEICYNVHEVKNMAQMEIFDTEITTLKRRRTIRVCLPDSYARGHQSYTVLYMHDGHNLFDVHTSTYGHIWDVQHALESYEQQYHEGLIIVGIDADGQHRLEEYSPWVSTALEKYAPELNDHKHGGEGEEYLAWMVKDLVPLINSRYRTNGINFMAGSSMGGLISLYAGLKYPKIFSKVGCFSSSFWFAKNEMTDFIKHHFGDALSVYLDCGTRETEDEEFNAMFISDTITISDLLQLDQNKMIKMIIEKGARHNEEAWAKRFPGFLQWLLKS
jgi:predicted alpha/beta superfamily hydrolase